MNGHLNDDSKHSEDVLSEAMKVVLPYAQQQAVLLGGHIIRDKKISLYDLTLNQATLGGPVPNIDDRSSSVIPDGSILSFIDRSAIQIPILVVEDKVQGTNDKRYSENKKKQALGNAIERAAKNKLAFEMLFTDDIFPYIIFASGCDFHPEHKISKRFNMMNYNYPNHYISVDPASSVQEQIEMILPNINILKRKIGPDRKCVASIFVKAHKWDEMEHGSSRWKKDEIVLILCTVLDRVFEAIAKRTS